MNNFFIQNQSIFSSWGTEQWHLLLTFFSTIAWVIYVYYTIRTFKEIKKQTDAQSRSYLILNTDERKDNGDRNAISVTGVDIHEKWSEILSNNYSDALKEVDVLIFILKNRGKSDIVNWEIKITGVVKPGEYLAKKINIVKEDFNINIKSATNQEIPPNEYIEIAVMPIGLFPLLELKWEISYCDILTEETYFLKSEGYEYENSNLIAYQASIEK